MHTQNQVEVNIIEIETKSAKIKEQYEKYEKFIDRRYFLHQKRDVYIAPNIMLLQKLMKRDRRRCHQALRL